MKGICALYEEETDLLESHIYPRFIIKHTKETGSRFLRNFETPNKREQDGPKLHLLGLKAEQKFSKSEKWFAENIFKPYLNEKFTLEYDENLYYFAISFLWRVIQLELRTSKTDFTKKWYYQKLIEAEKEWKEFLKHKTIPKNHHNANMLLTSRLKNNNSGIKGVDFYFTRALDATIVSNETKTTLLIYGKFNRFIFWSTILSAPYTDELFEVEINPNKGIIEVPQQVEFYPINSFISNRLRGVEKMPKASEAQQQKIEEEILKNIDDFWNSDLGESLDNDLSLDK